MDATTPFPTQTQPDRLAAEIIACDTPALHAKGQQAEIKRAEFLRRFPLADWPSLPLERYALGGGRNEDSLCWWLELSLRTLGSIRGGTANKTLIYRRKNGTGWYYPEGFADEQQAWVAVRAQFERALAHAANGEFDRIEPDFRSREGASCWSSSCTCISRTKS